MTAILGLSAFYHDAAATLLIDGRIVAAASQERFSRVKHDPAFPTDAVNYCLETAGLDPADLDYVGFYDKPIIKFERLLETYLAFAPSGYRSFRKSIPTWLNQKLHLPRQIDRGLGGRYAGRYVFTEHHESHAASAFFPSPFDQAAILSIDGVGEWATSCTGVGRGNRIELTDQIRFPHSLGLMYSAFTHYLGFRVNGGEYKVMGLAPYGRPIHKQTILDHLVDLKPDGSFRLDMRYFNYCQGLSMTSAKFHRRFGGPPRRPETELRQRDKDLAASIQAVTEDIMLAMARHLYATTRQKYLVMAGGVALNCVGVGRILRETSFDNVWVQPAAGDAGGSLGTATFIWHQLLDQTRNPGGTDSQNGSRLGPSYTDDEIVPSLSNHAGNHTLCASEDELCRRVCDLIVRQKVVGWFQGRMEFGPRALGSRSILADPRNPDMQSILNRRIKFRESFRPFAPIVLREHVDQYFHWDPHLDAPYMTHVAQVRMRSVHGDQSELPAITHVDGTARIQTVDRDRDPLLHRLLSLFHRQTGCPVMINTSFNVRGEPIVCTPSDAYECFAATDMDALAAGRHLIEKDLSSHSPPISHR